MTTTDVDAGHLGFVPACPRVARRVSPEQSREPGLRGAVALLPDQDQGAAVPASEDFVKLTEQFRRELLAHCYRMVGSADDAEDLVQETYLRAWRSYGGFEGRSSIRTWLYRIATNTCLTALQHRDRRFVPSRLGAPSDDPYAPLQIADPGVSWVQPIPDALVSTDPAEIVASRNNLRLALIVSLQYLPARQRAVLLLREVLAFPAAAVAEMLDTTTAAVKSSLQRARARLGELAAEGDQITEPTDKQAQALLDRYIAAFVNADAAALEQVLRADAALEMAGVRTWFAGRETCIPYLAAQVLTNRGEYRMLPTTANGQPAAAAYRLTDEGVYQAFGIAVLTTSDTTIVRITVFGDANLFRPFGFPRTLPLHGDPVEH